MKNFDLPEHLGQKFILDFLENWFCHYFSWPNFRLISLLRLRDLRIRVGNHIDVLQLKDFAIRTLPLVDFLSILVGNLQLTQKADELVAIKALLGFDWNLLANHAR
jgi:hypothetical protein